MKLHDSLLYFEVAMHTLLTSLEVNATDLVGPWGRVNVTFESQEAPPAFLAKKFPSAHFRVGREIVDSVCSFLSADVLVTSGSSMAVVAAFASHEDKPVIFEEVRKEARKEALGFKNGKVKVKRRYIFDVQRAVHLESGQALLSTANLKADVRERMQRLRARCALKEEKNSSVLSLFE
jgi:hypothetical protein